jgi:hypothetical protein
MSKYIIDTPDGVEWGVVTCRTEDGFYTRDFDSLEELNSDYINEHFGDLQDTAYQRGLEDAWNVARKIAVETDDGGVSISALYEMFGTESMCMIMKNNTVHDVTNKLKAYEEKQKADDGIKVGDEVAFHHDDGRPDTVVVVTYIGQDGFIDGMDGRGTQYAHKNPTNWTKTGRHFDIAKILEAMKND